MKEWEKLEQPQRRYTLALPPKKFVVPDMSLHCGDEYEYDFKLREVDIREIMFRAITFGRKRYLDVLVRDKAGKKIDLDALQTCITMLGGALYNPIIIIPLEEGWYVQDGARRVQINWESGVPTMNVVFLEYWLEGKLENTMWFKRTNSELREAIEKFMKRVQHRINYSYPELYQKT